MTTRQEIRDWFDQGVAEGKDYLIVVCDTFDYEDYPVYATAEHYPETIKRYVPASNMQQVMEIYDLNMDQDEQMKERRAWHAPTSNN